MAARAISGAVECTETEQGLCRCKRVRTAGSDSQHLVIRFDDLTVARDQQEGLRIGPG